MMPIPQKEKLPFIPRILNAIGKPAIYMGYGNLDLDSMEQKAQEEVGWSDFGNPLYREGALAFLDSVKSNPMLHFVGRLIVRDTMEQRLRTRLQLNRFLITQKRKLDEHLTERQRPVFVVGTPRSGTTLLYNLLALDPNARAPRFWEVLDPAPPASVLSQAEIDQRINHHDKRLTRFRRLLSSSFQRVHAVASAREYEEDFYLLEASFRCPSLAFVYGPAKHYRDYLFSLPEESIIQAYEEFADSIRVLMYSRRDDRRTYWLGKSPAHAPFSWAIPRVFPNAVLIHTHRNPAERIPSLCSLVTIVETLVCSPSEKREIGKRVLDYNRRSMEGISRSKREAEKNTSTIIDVDYESLKASPFQTVASIYDQIGWKLSDNFESGVVHWLENRNTWDPKKRGIHRYQPEEFGLDKRSLEAMDA